MKINRNTINAYYNRFRELIFEYSLKEQKQEIGEFELDESYFGARRIRGKRGRGEAGRTPVFGVTVVPNCSREELRLFREKFSKDQRFIPMVGRLMMV